MYFHGRPFLPLFTQKEKKLNLLLEYSFMTAIIIFEQKPIIKNPFAENQDKLFDVNGKGQIFKRQKVKLMMLHVESERKIFKILIHGTIFLQSTSVCVFQRVFECGFKYVRAFVSLSLWMSVCSKKVRKRERRCKI